MGHLVEQENYIGCLTELFAKFSDEWSARWDRHLHDDDTRWEPIIDFARLALPQTIQMEYNPITVHQWTSTLKSKSKRSATGPDGVSRQDLLHLPQKATEAVTQLFNGIEEGRTWPRQLTVL